MILSLTLFGCGGDEDGHSHDSGPGDLDSGGGDPDTGTPDEDSGTPDDDSGTPDEDAGTPDVDAGTPDVDAGMCMPVAEDSPRRNMSCLPPGGAGGVEPCPPGYVCDALDGIVVTYSCKIPCTRDCECPAGLTCEEMLDKSMMSREFFCEGDSTSGGGSGSDPRP